MPSRWKSLIYKSIKAWLISFLNKFVSSNIRNTLLSYLKSPASTPKVQSPRDTPESLEPKIMRNSVVEMTEILLPYHCDNNGVAFSGTLMSWIDVCAGISAKSHS